MFAISITVFDIVMFNHPNSFDSNIWPIKWRSRSWAKTATFLCVSMCVRVLLPFAQFLVKMKNVKNCLYRFWCARSSGVVEKVILDDIGHRMPTLWILFCDLHLKTLGQNVEMLISETWSLKVTTLNIRSINPNIYDIHDIMQDYNLHILTNYESESRLCHYQTVEKSCLKWLKPHLAYSTLQSPCWRQFRQSWWFGNIIKAWIHYNQSRSQTEIYFDICHRMAPLRMLRSLTLKFSRSNY